MKTLLRKLFYTTFVEAEKERERYCGVNKAFDFKAVVICVLTAFSLSMIYYLGRYEFLRNLLSGLGAASLLEKTDRFIYGISSTNLGELAYWVAMLVFFYFVLPVITVKFIFKEKLADYGVKWRGAFKDYYLYIIMLVVMIPLVLYFSTTTIFQSKYPFITLEQGHPLFPDFWKWEVLYVAQFFALEFFFRGFLLHGLKKRFGFYSVFVMTIPYCMIHFGKPLQETLAAIVAGVVLGCLSLKSNSIFLGCLIHVSVGFGMDFASLWQKGFFN
jgi:membrane protease YdiL (CAAX protease family)